MQMLGNVRKPFYSYIIYSTNICGDGGKKWHSLDLLEWEIWDMRC